MIPLVRQRLEFLQQRDVGQRGQRLGRRVESRPIHFFHQVAELAARAAIDQRVSHLVLGAEHGNRIGEQLADLRLVQRRQRGTVGNLGLGQGLLNHLQGLGGRRYRRRRARFPLAGVHLLGGDGQDAGEPLVLVEGGHVQIVGKAFGLGRRGQHVLHHVVVPANAAIAGQLRAGIAARRRADAPRGITLEAGKSIA